MPFFPQQIYFITDLNISGLTHAQQVAAFVSGGAGLIQLRDKLSLSDDLYTAAAGSLEVARKAGALLIINDRVDIALAVGADGVHLGQDDLAPAKARRLLGARAIIGFSTHSVEQAIAALDQPVDYIAIGPVFRTRTKPDHDPVIGLEGVAAVRKAIGTLPLVAIGGININNLASVIDAGADAVAVVSAALDPPDQISQNTRALLNNSV